jgi:hypothetical protein
MLSNSSASGEEEPWLLFTERVTPKVGEILRERGVGYVDTTGNAWIQQPGLCVWIEGRRAAVASETPHKATTPTALQLSFLLLKSREWCNRPYRELAARTGLALGTVGWIMSALTKAGHIFHEEERRALRLPRDLHVHWEQRWHDRLRPRLGTVLCKGKADPGFRSLLETCADEPEWIIGGELAATCVAGNVEPTTTTLHVPPAEVRACMQRLKLIPHPEGNIRIVETFGQENGWQRAERESGSRIALADPILIRAELLDSRDERLHLLASELLEAFIAPRWDS